MEKRVFEIMVLFSIAAIGMMNAAGMSGFDKDLSDKDVNEPLLRTMQAGQQTNETRAGQTILRDWNDFVENLNYSSDILNESVHGSLPYRDAMVLTSTLLVLNSNAMAELQGVNPGEEYADFHSATLNAMAYFNTYLFNMAKFYETEDGKYVSVARENFNMSQAYYTRGKSEAEFLF